MNRNFLVAMTLGVGAGAMYLADPRHGARRRARVRDGAAHYSRILRAAAGTTARDVRHRLTGLAARTAASLEDHPAPPDDVLAARVRTRLGRLVSHPHAIGVTAVNGVVTLTGPVLQAEVGQVLAGVGAVAGVAAVNNQLDARPSAGHVPALQGPGARQIPTIIERARVWSPATRLLAGAAGVALLAMSRSKQSMRKAAAGAAGLELLEHAVAGHRRT